MGDTGNDLSLFGNGILQEILSQRVGYVGSLVLMLHVENLKPLNCKHNLHGFFGYFGFQYFQLHLFAFV